MRERGHEGNEDVSTGRDEEEERGEEGERAWIRKRV